MAEDTELQAGLPATDAPLTGDGGVLPRLRPPQVAPRTVVAVLATALAFGGALFLLWQLRTIVRWAVIALFLATALDPAVDWLARRGVRRGLAIGLVFLALGLALGALGALVLPPLVEQTAALVDFGQELAQRPGGAEQGLREMAGRFGLGRYYDALRAQASSLPGRLGGAVGPVLGVLGGVVSSVTATLSILLLTFFLLLDGERFVAAGLTLFSTARRPQLRRLLGEASRAVSGYISGNLVISLIAGVAAFAMLTALDLLLPGGMPYTVVLALVVALFDLIPLVGATLGAAIVTLVGFFIGPTQGLILLAFFLVYQQLENNVLQPLVYGRSVRLHPAAIFLAVLAGGQLLGILGALLAIPVAEILRILAAEFLAGRARETGGAVHGAQSDAPVERVTADAAGPLA